MQRLKYVKTRSYPVKAWGIVLLVTFAVESMIMLALPYLTSPRSNLFVTSAIDATILTMTIAPVVWWVIVRPLGALLDLRTRHLNEVFQSIEEERSRVAAELHDGVGQSLTMLVSGLRTAAELSASDEVRRRCRELQQISQDALVEVKRITSGLRPSLLDDLGLASALTRLADDVTRHEGVEITVNLDGLPGYRLPAAVETATYRIIQEALQNVVKHAGARVGSVRVSLQDRLIVSHIEDDGCGLDYRQTEANANRAMGHLGLSGMRERATLLGGTVTIHSTPSKGTQVVAMIPIGGGSEFA